MYIPSRPTLDWRHIPHQPFFWNRKSLLNIFSSHAAMWRQLCVKTTFDAAVKKTKEQRAAVKKTKEQRAAVKKTKEQRAAVKKTKEQRAAVKKTKEQRAAVKKTKEQRAAVKKTKEQAPFSLVRPMRLSTQVDFRRMNAAQPGLFRGGEYSTVQCKPGFS